MSASAKRRGNEAFAAGDFARANKQFTMAIRMDKTNHVLFSNRSAARCGLGRFEEALADAERCVRMAPKWGKGYGRKGAALTGLGQGGEAVKAYVAGLAAEPGNEALREGLAEAKRAIRAAQDRYEEMWGKPAPGAAAAEDDDDSGAAAKTSSGAREVSAAPPPPAPAEAEVSAAAAGAAADAARAPSGSATAASPPPPPPSPHDLEVAAITREVNALDKADVRRWLDAAKAGDLATLEASHAANPALLYAWGKGTSLGFAGNSAMHWCAARGHAKCIRRLLELGMDPDVRNNADSTPAHSAAGAGQNDALRALLLEGGADAGARNDLGETPRDVANARREKPPRSTRTRDGGDKDRDDDGSPASASELAATIDLCSRVTALRRCAGGEAGWDLRTVRAVAQLAGVDARGFSEKREFVDAARRVLAEAAPLVAPPGGRWKPAPSLAATTEETTPAETTTRAEAAKEGRARSTSSSSSAAASSAGAKRADEGKREREPREEEKRDAAASASAAADSAEASAKARASSDVGPPDDSSGARDDSDSDTDEETRAATLAAMSASAKRRGNEAFAAGDFARANKQFTMAIRMDKTNHVLFSNRSAARCGLGRFEEALADAERCVRMAPKWGKGYGRKGAALTGLGQGGEAVKAYVAGLAAEPGNEALREGLAEAKRAIRAAQDRYEEMWGKPAPGAAAAEEE